MMLPLRCFAKLGMHLKVAFPERLDLPYACTFERLLDDDTLESIEATRSSSSTPC